METDTTEIADSQNSETGDTQDTTATDIQDVAALQAKITEYESTNRQLFERAKKAEGFVKVDGKWVKAPKPEEAIQTKQELQAKTGELDEMQLDYLELKGITEQEDIDFIQKVMKRTGETLRQTLKDEIVSAKLKANTEKRSVQNATPSNTKRSGGSAPSIEAALAKYEATGELPNDFEMQSAVINAKIAKSSGTLPPWRR